MTWLKQMFSQKQETLEVWCDLTLKVGKEKKSMGI